MTTETQRSPTWWWHGRADSYAAGLRMCSCDFFRRCRSRPPSTLLHDKDVLRLHVAVPTELLESVQAYAQADRQSRDRRCDIGCCALARDGQHTSGGTSKDDEG